MTRYHIDCTHITTRKELHKQLARECHFPAWYGHNLDALMDVLTDLCEDTVLELSGMALLETQLGKYAVTFRKVLQAAMDENAHLTVLYQDAETISDDEGEVYDEN